MKYIHKMYKYETYVFTKKMYIYHVAQQLGIYPR